MYKSSIFFWLLVTVFCFPAFTKAQTVYTCPSTISLRSLFTLTPDNTGGIKCIIPSGQQGSVVLTVRQFDPARKDNLGGMLYSVSLNQSSDSYTGNAISYSIGDATQPLTPFLQAQLLKQTTWSGDDYRHAAIASEYYTKAAHGEDLRTIIEYSYPVVVQLTIDNATVSSVKIPGQRTPIPFTSFQSLPFLKVLDAIQNPLNYPDYTIIAAHRGYWKDVPENSYPAYDLCAAAGTDMVELDTRLTKDDSLVAFHDACLNRITTGTGLLRDYTWEQLKQLQLKDRFGNPTGLRIVTIREALLYLKGRALVNLDIKEWITKDASGKVITDLLTPTMKAALKIAKETGTLNQLVIKGKLAPDDFQDDILDEVGISLNDFVYTPVAFGWDTPDMPSYVSNWLNEGAPALELTYKVAYDPILRFVPVAINRNKRVGIYTFWPEDCNGVIAEDRLKEPPPDNCKYTYREYYFLNEDKAGYSKEIGTPLTPVSGEGSAGESGEKKYTESSSSESGESGYGGGSFDDLYPKPPAKLSKPGGMNDGRGDWDWLFSKGANFVITDRPVLMNEYLKARGKRTLEIPLITEVEIPGCITINNGTGGVKTYTNLRGMVRRISDYSKADFFTPDTRMVPIDTNLIFDQYKQYNNDRTIEWVRSFISSNKRICNCADVFDNSPAKSIRQFPLHTLPDWSVIYPGFDIYINGNWFDVKEPFPLNDPPARKAVPKAPYKFGCSDVFGFWQSSGGTVLSKVEDPDPDHNNLDAFLIDASNNKVTMVKNADVPSYENGKSAKFAIGGYIIATGGKPVPYAQLPPGSSKDTPKKKTLIGLNGNELYIAEFQSPMLGTYQAADLMVKYFNCTDVFMADGGGSTTMLSTRGDFPAVNASAGPNITSGSAAEDRDILDRRGYRPVPNFLAIKAKQNP